MKNKLFNIDKKSLAALATTFVWASFIVISLFSALSLRGDIVFSPWVNDFLGSAQAIFALIVLIVIIYQANIKK